VSKRSSRDPRLKKQAVLSEIKKESQIDAVEEVKNCGTPRRVSKMSVVEYQRREAAGKATQANEKENSAENAVLLKDAEAQASVNTSPAGQATPGGKRKRCHGGSNNEEMWLMRKTVEEALNHQNGLKQTDTTDYLETAVECLARASICEETGDEESRAMVERMLAELEQLSKEMEEEKEKSRRLHKENEDLDIELELILEGLK